MQALESTGLRPASDPRLKEMVQNIQKFQNKIETTQDVSELVIGRKEFKELIFENIVLISRALRRQFIIPDFLGFTRYVDTFYEAAKENTNGTIPDYIPQLAKQDPEVSQSLKKQRDQACH